MNKQSTKCFSYIHGGEIRIAPKTKVIPAEEFSTLQSAQEVLIHANNDAEQYKRDVVAEIELIKEQAHREGFEAGYTEWAEKLAKLEEEIHKVRKDLEQKIVPVAIQAAKKIVNKELEISQKTIVDIVSSSLKSVSQHKKVTIYVNQNDLTIIENKRAELKAIFENLETMSIRPRADIKPGGCVIETEVGIINAQLENRWRILEAAFGKMLQHK